MADITVTVSGPFFDGRATQRVDAFLRDATAEVAQQGLADVHQLLDLSIREPTPYYETQIMTQRVLDDMVVHDRGIIYGPWLEGVSERNRTTRFKGYHSFRRATEGLRGKVAALIRPILDRHVRGMN